MSPETDSSLPTEEWSIGLSILRFGAPSHNLGNLFDNKFVGMTRVVVK